MKFLALAILVIVATGAQAQFTPGHVYISDRPQEPCFIGPPSNPNDRIWDVDPVTGESELLVEVPDGLCGWISGLAFNPAGTHLRGSMFFPSTILEFDAAGGIGVALDSSDGIALPIGGNNIAYDPLENFYVVNAGSSTILRFPPDGGPATVLADGHDTIIAAGAIALFPNSDVLYGSELRRLQTITFTFRHIGDDSGFERRSCSSTVDASYAA